MRACPCPDIAVGLRGDSCTSLGSLVHTAQCGHKNPGYRAATPDGEPLEHGGEVHKLICIEELQKSTDTRAL